jgi:hypothetical protein
MLKATKRLLRRAYPLYRPLLSTLGLIDTIARMHGPDKRTHGYIEHYKRHFNHLRLSKLKLFEIGVGGYELRDGGASLRMWKDFFPKAEIFGLDIVDKSHLQEHRIKILQGDQNDPAFLDEIASRWGPFDIIIDDGSHMSEHIITSFRTLFPHLTPNGLYVIEDLNFSYEPAFGGSSIAFDDPRTSVGMLKTLIDDMHFKYMPGRKAQSYGDLITGMSFYPKICFIQKGDNTSRDTYVESFSPAHRVGHEVDCQQRGPSGEKELITGQSR